MSIEVQQQLDEVETTPPVEVGVSSKVGDVDVVNTIEVTAYVPKYTICGDDIYIAQYTTEPPLWLTDLIEYKTSTSQLANDVDDLEDSFQNFQDGYTQQIAYLQNQNNAMAFDISTLKVSNNINVAGIQRLDSTKITASDAEAIATATIGAWSNTTGGAWFDSKISTVSNVAYSAARSAANLTAVMNSQQDQLLAIVGDVSTLQKQVDGKVETWFGTISPVNPDGSVNTAVEPYATWLANDELGVHTGDSYIHYELDMSGNKVILGTYKFVYDTDTDTYQWSLFSDDLASEAYNRALQAQDTADSKIVTYYQTFPPTGASLGDLWLDSDDSDKLYRYNGTNWVAVDDKRISASVQRLDEATVTVDGTARAKSSLKVDANGVVSGYVAESGSTSKFKIYADEFSIARYDNGQEVGNPFVVDTTTNKIKFTGSVSFAGTAVDTALQQGDAANDINNGTTTIDGGKITTGTITASQIKANAITTNQLSTNIGLVNGYIYSSDFNGNVSGDIGYPTKGFRLSSNAAGTYSDPTIYGAYIRGGTISAESIVSGSLTKTNYFRVVNKHVDDAYMHTLVDIDVDNSSGQAILMNLNLNLRNGGGTAIAGQVLIVVSDSVGQSSTVGRAIRPSLTNQYGDTFIADGVLNPYIIKSDIKETNQWADFGDETNFVEYFLAPMIPAGYKNIKLKIFIPNTDGYGLVTYSFGIIQLKK